MSTAALNAEHGSPERLVFDAGPGDWPCAQLLGPRAQARVSLHGAQVLSFVPQGGDDLLFLSARAVYQPGKAIRGGVPVCWPWFGPDPQGLGRPAHGFARTRSWAVRGTAVTPAGDVSLTLGLNDSPDTRALWPHAFDLSMEITVGSRLRLVLTTHNTGDAPWLLTQALHSYFAVGDIARTHVLGLDGCDFTDKAAGAPGGVARQTGPVGFHGELDRVYTGTPPLLWVADGGRARRLRMACEGSRSAVVWNPGPVIAAAMTDLPDDAYRHFVCVETANVADDAVTLAPGGTHRLVADIGLCEG
jgi:glucose-6-phosphate 1-epimerase